MLEERIQKVLASKGLGSRRQIENWIKEGQIQVNGKPAVLGDKISEKDRVSLNGRPVKLSSMRQPSSKVLIYFKPEGEICTRHDPERRPTVYRKLPKLKQQRWIAVGRLDINTSGLLLFTTDGALANKLMHPSYEVEREYLVRVHGKLSDSMIEALTKGVTIDGEKAAFSRLYHHAGSGANHWYRVVLKEGKNREVRRLFATQGLDVNRLKRIRYGNVALTSELKQGQWRELSAGDVRQIYSSFQ